MAPGPARAVEGRGGQRRGGERSGGAETLTSGLGSAQLTSNSQKKQNQNFVSCQTQPTTVSTARGKTSRVKHSSPPSKLAAVGADAQQSVELHSISLFSNTSGTVPWPLPLQLWCPTQATAHATCVPTRHTPRSVHSGATSRAARQTHSRCICTQLPASRPPSSACPRVSRNRCGRRRAGPGAGQASAEARVDTEGIEVPTPPAHGARCPRG